MDPCHDLAIPSPLLLPNGFLWWLSSTYTEYPFRPQHPRSCKGSLHLIFLRGDRHLVCIFSSPCSQKHTSSSTANVLEQAPVMDHFTFFQPYLFSAPVTTLVSSAVMCPTSCTWRWPAKHLLPSRLRLLCLHYGLGQGRQPLASSYTQPGSAGEWMAHRVFSDQGRTQADRTPCLLSHSVVWDVCPVASQVPCGVKQCSKRTSQCFTLLHCCFLGSSFPSKIFADTYFSHVLLSGEIRLRCILCSSFQILKYSSSSELKTSHCPFLRGFSSILISSPPPVSKILIVLRDVSWESQKTHCFEDLSCI